MLRRVGLSVLTAFWGAVVFGLVFRLSFPSERAAAWVAWQVDRSSGGQWALQVAEVNPWRVSGVELSQAELFSRPPAPTRRRAQGAEDGPPEPGPADRILQATRAAVRLRLLPLLRGRIGTAVDAELYGGTLAGTVTKDGDAIVLDLLAKDLDLAQYPLEGPTFQADMQGLLRIKAETLRLDQADPKNSRGVLRFEATDLKLSNASVMGLTLGEATFTEAILRFDVSDGKARVKKGSFVSDLVQVQIDGDINLAVPMGRSRLRLDLSVRLSEELDTLAGLVPNLKSARDSDGLYHMTCTGTLDRPMCREVNQARASRRSQALQDSLGDDALDGADAELDDVDAEQRKREREERLEERRRRLRERRDQRLRDQGRPPAPEMPMPGEDPDADRDPVDMPSRLPLDEDLDLDRVPVEDYEDEGPPGEMQDMGYME